MVSFRAAVAPLAILAASSASLVDALPSPVRRAARPDLAGQLRQVEQRGRALAASLPTNRAYLDAIRALTQPVIPS